MHQQLASDGKTAMPSTAVTVQPVHNFLQHRHAAHSQAVCATAHSTVGPSLHDRAKPGKHSPRTDSIADALSPPEEEEAFSCRQRSSSSPPPHCADAEPSASTHHTVKEEEDLTRSREILMNKNAAAVSSDHTADEEEEDEGAGRTDKGLPTNSCFTPSEYVPADVIAKWGHVLDIVTPHSTVTNCFTKTYSRFAKVRVPHLHSSVPVQTTSLLHYNTCCTCCCAAFPYILHLTQPCDSRRIMSVHL